MVVVVVVVVVVSPGSVLLVVVVVVVVVVVDVVLMLVVSPGRVVLGGGAGHEAVAFVGIRTADDVICLIVVVVATFKTVESGNVDSGILVSIGARARDAAGATAGASLWSHVSN